MARHLLLQNDQPLVINTGRSVATGARELGIRSRRWAACVAIAVISVDHARRRHF
jgi:hypothetical protein